MSKKSGAARAEQAPKKAQFNVRPDEALDARIRRYVLTAGISFNDLALEALREYLERHPRWPKPTGMKLPRGPRLKLH